MSSEQLENFEELGRRAVACKRWRWMPGMLSTKGLRVTRRDRDGYVVGYYENLSYIAECVPGSLPDLTDHATVGCLLAIVREAWPGCYAEPNGAPEWDGIIERERDSWWRVYGFGRIPRPLGYGPTEAGALVAALEAAP